MLNQALRERDHYLQGMYEMQAQILHMLNSIDNAAKNEIYVAIDRMDVPKYLPKRLRID